jgi:hypothetical protein
MEAYMRDETMAFFYEDGKNMCYLNPMNGKAPEEEEFIIFTVTGCESIGWKEGKSTDTTISGPNGVEYYIFFEEEYRKNLEKYNNNN